jgi:hypothetical protein
MRMRELDPAEEGLILWETGCGENYSEVCGAPVNDIFGQDEYHPDQELYTAIAKAGYYIKVRRHRDTFFPVHFCLSLAWARTLGLSIPQDVKRPIINLLDILRDMIIPRSGRKSN